MFLQKTFSKFSKFLFLQDSTDRVYFSTDRKGKRKIQFFSLKSRACSIPSQFPLISRAYFHVHFDSSRSIGFHFFKHMGIRPVLLKLLFVFLSDSSLDPFSPFFFLVIFLGQRFKGFLQTPKVRHFCPFFFIKLHDFMHFLMDFCTYRILGFLIFLGILIKTKSWVFLHASFKHDSHTLISKFSQFINFFEIRVLKFLRDLGILLNWIKLNKFGLCY